ncbi:hypothetical protein CMV_023665 [Castanea mollissima]|uniref:Uncharacterized protein n=1 Tax=Castanea mollissima TaxID=60419 RepID=A0A8J4VJ40_9ROSI|nr:hypothetical protein CMV_023665 [Castanea mollissima]
MRCLSCFGCHYKFEHELAVFLHHWLVQIAITNYGGVFVQEIAMMEEELKVKTEIIKKQEKLIQGWRKELKDQLDKHNAELERV